MIYVGVKGTTIAFKKLKKCAFELFFKWQNGVQKCFKSGAKQVS